MLSQGWWEVFSSYCLSAPWWVLLAQHIKGACWRRNVSPELTNVKYWFGCLVLFLLSCSRGVNTLTKRVSLESSQRLCPFVLWSCFVHTLLPLANVTQYSFVTCGVGDSESLKLPILRLWAVRIVCPMKHCAISIFFGFVLPDTIRNAWLISMKRFLPFFSSFPYWLDWCTRSWTFVNPMPGEFSNVI